MKLKITTAYIIALSVVSPPSFGANAIELEVGNGATKSKSVDEICDTLYDEWKNNSLVHLVEWANPDLEQYWDKKTVLEYCARKWPDLS